MEAGAKFRRREKSNDIDIRVFDGFPGDPTFAMFAVDSVDYDQGAFGLGVSEDAIDRFIASNLSGFELNDDDTLAASTGGDYSMNEDVDAVFLKNRLDIDALRIVYGLRYERTAFEAEGIRVVYDDVGADGDPALVTVAFANDYASVLPSVNLRYAISDDLLLRAAFYQTMARPKFGDLAPGGEVEFEEDDGENVLKAQVGNPDLEPLRAQNFDLSIEDYREDVGLLPASVYYKTLEDFVVLADTASIIDFTQFVGNNRVDEAEVIQPINGDDANLSGVELTWVQQLSSLPRWLRNLLVSANVTLTGGEATIPFRDEKIPMPRQADLVTNFALGYESERLSARVALAHKSERLIGLEELDDPAFDVFQDAHTQLDLGVKFFVNDQWQLYFDANNLSDEPYYAYFGERRYNAQYETYGRTFAFGVLHPDYRATEARRWRTETQPEGCVADDDAGVLYIGEEGYGVWTLPADPGEPAELAPFAAIADGGLVADVERLALYQPGNAELDAKPSYLVVSSQGDDSYAVYDTQTRARLGSFRVGGHPQIDETSNTDGIAVTSSPLPGFPDGLLVVQDGDNPGGNQNFKLVSWSEVGRTLGL